MYAKIKDQFIDYLTKIILNLGKWLENQKKASSFNDDLPYHSLSPVENADQEGEYTKALTWAIENRQKEEIRNIALTGPYGSGKSSILKTYIKNNINNSLHFLPISLATFKEEKTPIAPEVGNDNQINDLQRLIELSILQQIFYREGDDKIPDSRFRKIKKISGKKIGLITFGTLLLIITLLILFEKNVLLTFLGISLLLNERIDKILFYLSLIYSVSFVGVFLFNIMRALQGIRINKLNIQNAEIEISNKINKSILNQHLDEILYFFEVTGYNVVIIEDLDRFEQTEIFTKLREINLLINNSEKIKEDVVFVYAVRDDMFQDKDRVKFFDFVIPVIPVINSSNSSEKLSSILKSKFEDCKIGKELIDNVSFFIDDMRLLYNIINEYYLYHKLLAKQLSQEKLFAILVYKNIFPNDFSCLINSEGYLYNIIEDKNRYIKQEIQNINDKIKILTDEIKILEKLKIKDISELNRLYASEYLQKYWAELRYDSYSGSKGLYKDQVKLMSITDLSLDENFQALINGNIRYYNPYDRKWLSLPWEFETIEKNVDSTFSYPERKQQIIDFNRGKINATKKQISDLKNTHNH